MSNNTEQDWRALYRDLYCAIWCVTPEEFEAETGDHEDTVAEALRDWRVRYEVDQLKEQRDVLLALAKRSHDVVVIAVSANVTLEDFDPREHNLAVALRDAIAKCEEAK